jgi:hypothetical protein
MPIYCNDKICTFCAVRDGLLKKQREGHYWVAPRYECADHPELREILELEKSRESCDEWVPSSTLDLVNVEPRK